MMLDVLLYAREVNIILIGSHSDAIDASGRLAEGIETGGDYIAVILGISAAAAHALRCTGPGLFSPKLGYDDRDLINASRIVACVANGDDDTAIAIANSAVETDDDDNLLRLLISVVMETRRVLTELHTGTPTCPVCSSLRPPDAPVVCVGPGSRPTNEGTN